MTLNFWSSCLWPLSAKITEWVTTPRLCGTEDPTYGLEYAKQAITNRAVSLVLTGLSVSQLDRFQSTSNPSFRMIFLEGQLYCTVNLKEHSVSPWTWRNTPHWCCRVWKLEPLAQACALGRLPSPIALWLLLSFLYDPHILIHASPSPGLGTL